MEYNEKQYYLTDTERLTLKHILGLNRHLIERFEDLNLDDETRSFLIFEVMLPMYEKAQKKK